MFNPRSLILSRTCNGHDVCKGPGGRGNERYRGGAEPPIILFVIVLGSQTELYALRLGQDLSLFWIRIARADHRAVLLGRSG